MSNPTFASGSPAATNGTLMLVARILMAHIFIVAGIRKIMQYDGMVAYIASKLPMADLLTPLVIVFEIGAGVLFILGWRTRTLAWLMAAFCVVAGCIFHNFLQAPDAAFTAQMNNFMKNLAMAGGFIMFAIFGPGPKSIDKQ